MWNEEHLAILRQGVEVWNEWRQENLGIRPDLSQADLRDANLDGVVLREATLQGAILIGCTLHRANFEGANLFGANLDAAALNGANLQTVNLQWSNLQGTILREANLQGANLQGAILRINNVQAANFAQALLGGTVFVDVNLRGIHNLDKVRHYGRSSIGIDTLYKSGGHIPEIFLRGCGVPDSMIEYARSLVAAERPIDYYSCFISYSSKDEALAKRLYADLQAAGVRCWFTPHDLKIGESIIDGIDQGIRLHEKLLLILSESSVASRWVGTEVKTALMREHNEGRTVLFPIRLDDAVLKSATGWAGQVQERHIGDFCKWKDHDAYQSAFARLLRDLRAG